jgi:ABC-type multidrug transport system permease subunit
VPFHYYIEGLAVNELAHVIVSCTNSDFLKFPPPPNMNCGEYMTNFFLYGAPGYINNASATDVCDYCPFKSGKEFYTMRFDWSEDNKWRNVGILFGFFFFNVIVFIILVYLKRKPRR